VLLLVLVLSGGGALPISPAHSTADQPAASANHFPNSPPVQAIMAFREASFTKYSAGVAVPDASHKAGPDQFIAVFANTISIGYIGSGPAINTAGPTPDNVNGVSGAVEGNARGQNTTSLALPVLGHDGRTMDRLAVMSGDVLLRVGGTVQDESASTATVRGPLAQVDIAQRLLILNVSPQPSDDLAPGSPNSLRRSDVVIVLLLPGTRLVLPRGQTLGDLETGQTVQVTGTLNWRTHSVLRPTSVVVGAAPRAQQCTTLSVSGDQDCAGEPANEP